MKQDMTLITGEFDTNSVIITFEFVTLKGGYMPLTKCPFIKRNRENKIGDETSINGRSITTNYTVEHPFLLKMICINLGYKEIFIGVDDKAPYIKITGAKGYGGFEGRGNVDLEKSRLNGMELKLLYNYKVILPSKESSKSTKNQRKIVLDKS